MKLAKIALENFRHLGTAEAPFELSFTDALDRVRDFTLLVGPNASGKTTVLDAIALALGRSVGMESLRPDLKVTPRTIVRRGELQAKVTCWLRFSEAEIEATRELFRLGDVDQQVPDTSEVRLVWRYPAPREPRRLESSGWASTIYATPPFYLPKTVSASAIDNRSPKPSVDYGVIQTNPHTGWLLLHGREQVSRLLATGRADWSWLRRVGGVFTFDQDRTGLAKTVSRQVWNIIHGARETEGRSEELRTADPRAILVDLALRSVVPAVDLTEPSLDEFRLIQEEYARVCHPHRLLGAVRDELGDFDIRFTDGDHEYRYEGLSSGEKNVLLLLIRFAAEHMHQSVVLIDELELNQHPIWQRKLLDLVPRMGENNQIIATTHSPYLRDAVRPDAVIDFGSLDEKRLEEAV